MSINLEEVRIGATSQYEEEFFSAIAAQERGRYFRFQENITESRLRNLAQTNSKAYGIPFSVYKKTDENGNTYFAVGIAVTNRGRRTARKAVREAVTA